MDKISGIIPPTARTATADTSGAQPARPGAPAMGRPMGKNSLGDRVILSKKMEEMKATGQIPELETSPVYKNPAEAKKLKVVSDLNAKFFNDSKALAKDSEMSKSEDVLKKTDESEGLFFVEKEMRPAAEPLVAN